MMKARKTRAKKTKARKTILSTILLALVFSLFFAAVIPPRLLHAANANASAIANASALSSASATFAMMATPVPAGATSESFMRLTVVGSTRFEEHADFVSYTISLKNSGNVDLQVLKADAILAGERAQTQLFSLPRGSVKELIFYFAKPAAPGTYSGNITVGVNETILLVQPILLTVELPEFSAPSTPKELTRFLWPVLILLALLAIVLVSLSKLRRKKKLGEAGFYKQKV